jgi:hypothetical protein
MRDQPSRNRAALVAAAAGATMIIGGEALCVFGPLRYETVIHRVCHAILYAGIGLAGVSVVLHGGVGRR